MNRKFRYFGLDAPLNVKKEKLELVEKIYNDEIGLYGFRRKKDSIFLVHTESLIQNISPCYCCRTPFCSCFTSSVEHGFEYQDRMSYRFKDILSHSFANGWEIDDIVDDLNLHGLFAERSRGELSRVHDKSLNVNKCILYREIQKGKKGCMFDFYCEETGYNILDYKPLACSLFPMDIIWYKDKYLVFAKMKMDTMLDVISRFPNRRKEWSCFNEKDARIIDIQKNILIKCLGADGYDEILSIVES